MKYLIICFIVLIAIYNAKGTDLLLSQNGKNMPSYIQKAPNKNISDIKSKITKQALEKRKSTQPKDNRWLNKKNATIAAVALVFLFLLYTGWRNHNPRTDILIG